ncbi:MAG: ubiquinol-cytochrome C chaperone family protein, partial [Hellea sp.]|nr:ubiquinol-cytochrome C chaperone family protein [Hellea sp.]
MLNGIKKLFSRNNSAVIDAKLMYSLLMKQSRKKMFYGSEKVRDNYDGRIDILTLHMAIVLTALRGHDINGKLLSQALFDVMRDDF